ncbi:PilZ domain-containing protein [Sphingomonas sp. R86520]|uniref:PilZ domain-containing protein n=1 Tax=Sphingomonas sp. R86520 TaxID=3093859 RepID=UPI0036D35B06
MLQSRELSVACRMNVGGKWSDGCIHEVSDKGVLLSSDSPPAIGTYVDIRRGTLAIIGRVVWNGGSRFGVRTRDPVSIAALIAEPVLKSRPPTSDRRTLTREDAARRNARHAERNRQRSAAFQFICLAIAGLGIAYFAAISCYNALAAPLAAAADVLNTAAT